MSTAQKIYVAGHRGMVGSAIVRQLQCQQSVTPGKKAVIADKKAVIAGSDPQSMTPTSWIADHVRNDNLTIITRTRTHARTHAELDLSNQAAAQAFFASEKPTQPDGSPRKLMDSTRLNALGWQAQVNLEQVLALAYQDFKHQIGL